ncbi:MAG: T9SS type A sorting domain-containing protein [Bacteroidales bacterium]|nr:T9SS type A sorting domain-containing protein [Bacteroidales bacterium]
MKKLTLILILSVITLFAVAQQTARTLTWDETQRDYLEYVPTSYTGDVPAPVVFCLHGLGDDMNNFSNVGFNYVADLRGWIVITPQALMASIVGVGEIGTAWNSGAGIEDAPYLGDIILNEGVDDSGFLMAILDSLENHFNIDTDSVFFMGFSMGGFMSNRMGAEYSDRITAVASVSGTIGKFFTPNPTSNINTLHIHGTADETVAYEDAGFDTGMGIYPVGMGAEELVEYWRNFNNAEETPIVNIFPDTQDDGKTFERYVYPNGDDDTYTAFIKVVGGDHEWYYLPQNDMDYTTEIYKFFTNTMDFSVGRVNNLEKSNFSIYPNPAKDYVTVFSGSENSIVKIYNMLGNLKSIVKLDRNNVIDISGLSEGMYIMRFSDGAKTIDKKLVVRR